MENEQEWSEWHRHDGCGCPCVGKMVQVKVDIPLRPIGMKPGIRLISPICVEYIPMNPMAPVWTWKKGCVTRVIEYRIRKPKALTEMIEVLRTMDAKEDA